MNSWNDSSLHDIDASAGATIGIFTTEGDFGSAREALRGLCKAELKAARTFSVAGAASTTGGREEKGPTVGSESKLL